MADPARVKSDPGSNIVSTQSIQQDKNAGEGPSGGNVQALGPTMNQPAIKQEDKLVRRDVADQIHCMGKS